MADRVTQEAIESIESGIGGARITQEAAEVLHLMPPVNAGITQLAIEVLIPRPPLGRFYAQIF